MNKTHSEAEHLRALVEAGLVAVARERIASLTPEQLADPDVASWARVLRLPVARRVPRLTGAAALRALIDDLRAVGIPYEPDLTFPAPVRHQSALLVALGTLCKRGQERTPLGRRVLESIGWVEAVSSRLRWAALGWFKPAGGAL